MWSGFFERSAFDAHEILDGVYLGSYDAATANFAEFESRNIAYVLTIGNDMDLFHLAHGVTYLSCRCDDLSDTVLLPNFAIFHKFIQFARDQKKGVLIHCQAGISRSTTTLCSFMMMLDKQDFETACNRIRQQRRFVSPNYGFEKQLRAYEYITTGAAHRKEAHDKFAAMRAPAVQLARFSQLVTVTEPSQVAPFLERVMHVTDVADSAARDKEGNSRDSAETDLAAAIAVEAVAETIKQAQEKGDHDSHDNNDNTDDDDDDDDGNKGEKANL